MPHQAKLKIITPANDPTGSDPIPIPAGADMTKYTVVADGEAPLAGKNAIATAEFRKNGAKVTDGKQVVAPRHWVVVFEGAFAGAAVDPAATYSVFVKDTKGKQDEHFFSFVQL
jgi:hypothetical protein